MGRQIDEELKKLKKKINKLRSIEYFLETHTFDEHTIETVAKYVRQEDLENLKKMFSEYDLDNLEIKPMNVLKTIAQRNLIPHWSRMQRADLIRAIRENICVSK